VGQIAWASWWPLMTSAPTLNDRQRAYLLAIFETDQELS
jgi:hypothetical protein